MNEKLILAVVKLFIKYVIVLFSGAVVIATAYLGSLWFEISFELILSCAILLQLLSHDFDSYMRSRNEP